MEPCHEKHAVDEPVSGALHGEEGKIMMTESQEIERKIELKRQAVGLLSEEVNRNLVLIGRWERDIELLERMLHECQRKAA